MNDAKHVSRCATWRFRTFSAFAPKVLSPENPDVLQESKLIPPRERAESV